MEATVRIEVNETFNTWFTERVSAQLQRNPPPVLKTEDTFKPFELDPIQSQSEYAKMAQTICQQLQDECKADLENKTINNKKIKPILFSFPSILAYRIKARNRSVHHIEIITGHCFIMLTCITDDTRPLIISRLREYSFRLYCNRYIDHDLTEYNQTYYSDSILSRLKNPNDD